MNKILEINTEGLYAVVEPGVRTSDLQDAAEQQDLFYAGDPCSGDSCFIGGNIATTPAATGPSNTGRRATRYTASKS